MPKPPNTEFTAGLPLKASTLRALNDNAGTLAINFTTGAPVNGDVSGTVTNITDGSVNVVAHKQATYRYAIASATETTFKIPANVSEWYYIMIGGGGGGGSGLALSVASNYNGRLRPETGSGGSAGQIIHGKILKSNAEQTYYLISKATSGHDGTGGAVGSGGAGNDGENGKHVALFANKITTPSVDYHGLLDFALGGSGGFKGRGQFAASVSWIVDGSTNASTVNVNNWYSVPNPNFIPYHMKQGASNFEVKYPEILFATHRHIFTQDNIFLPTSSPDQFTTIYARAKGDTTIDPINVNYIKTGVDHHDLKSPEIFELITRGSFASGGGGNTNYQDSPITKALSGSNSPFGLGGSLATEVNTYTSDSSYSYNMTGGGGGAGIFLGSQNDVVSGETNVYTIDLGVDTSASSDYFGNPAKAAGGQGTIYKSTPDNNDCPTNVLGGGGGGGGSIRTSTGGAENLGVDGGDGGHGGIVYWYY